MDFKGDVSDERATARLLPLSFQGLSSQGIRPENEDAIVMISDTGVFAAIDGHGSGGRGAVAAALVAKHLEAASSPEGIVVALETANAQIVQMAEGGGEGFKMGATAAVACVSGSNVEILHVGDVRAYLATPGSVAQLTEDHTLANQLVKLKQLKPEDAATHPTRKTLVRYLGKGPELKVSRSQVVLGPADSLVLCTDGIYQSLTPHAFSEIAKAPDRDVERCITTLRDRALAGGSDDNLSLVAVRLAEPTPVRAGPLEASRGLRELVEELLTAAAPQRELERLCADLLDVIMGTANAGAGVLMAVQGPNRSILCERRQHGPSGPAFETLYGAAIDQALESGRARIEVGGAQGVAISCGATWQDSQLILGLVLPHMQDLQSDEIMPFLEIGAWYFALRAIAELREGRP